MLYAYCMNMIMKDKEVSVFKKTCQRIGKSTCYEHFALVVLVKKSLQKYYETCVKHDVR